MRCRRSLSLSAVAVIAAAAWSTSSLAQAQRPPQPGPNMQPGPNTQRPPQAQPPRPYQPVPVAAPKPINDPSFEAFRKQLADIAQRKDRNALARLVVAQGFFWDGDQGDKADKRRPGIDNLTKALNLTAKDGSGWETLAGYVSDPTGSTPQNHQNATCAPGDPVFDVQAFETLVKATGTEESDWAVPTQPGVEVRSGPQANAPVIEKLGMNLVRVMQDNTAPSNPNQPPPLRVVTPSGKVGYVAGDAIGPLGSDQLCYVKDAGGWKIAGFIGGDQ